MPPLCKIKGFVKRGGTCDKMIVGGNFCGYNGYCVNKSKPEPINKSVNVAASPSAEQGEGT